MSDPAQPCSVHSCVVNTSKNEGVLGLDALTSLGFTIGPGGGKIASVVGCKHRIKFNPDSIPAVTPVLRLLIFLIVDLTPELQRLLQAGIIKKKEFSQPA